jgi:hypothetical protein
MRDLTDTMYNPARWPYISHFEGTERIIEHIEKFVCPTTTSDQILGGSRRTTSNARRHQWSDTLSPSFFLTLFQILRKKASGKAKESQRLQSSNHPAYQPDSTSTTLVWICACSSGLVDFSSACTWGSGTMDSPSAFSATPAAIMIGSAISEPEFASEFDWV